MMSELCYLAAISSMMDTKLFEHVRQKIPFLIQHWQVFILILWGGQIISRASA